MFEIPYPDLKNFVEIFDPELPHIKILKEYTKNIIFNSWSQYHAILTSVNVYIK